MTRRQMITSEFAIVSAMIHLIRIIPAITVIMLCTLLPFLPGRYDRLAVPLSLMAQFVGIFGMALTPVGLFWIAAERLPRLAQKRYSAAFVALIVSSMVWVLVCLAAVLEGGFAFGIFSLALG